MEIGNGGDGKKLTGRVPTSVAAISLIINTNTLAAARYYNSIADGKSNFRCRLHRWVRVLCGCYRLGRYVLDFCKVNHELPPSLPPSLPPDQKGSLVLLKIGSDKIQDK